MATKTSLECDGCQRVIEKTEVDVVLLGIPTGQFDDKLNPIFTPVHACKACQDGFTVAQLNVKLRSRAE